MTVLDLSQYDLPTLDVAEMRAYGVTGAILGVFSPNNPPHDMANAADRLIAGGIPVKAWYGLAYYGSAYGATRDITWAAQLARQFKTPYVFVDSEIDGTGIFTDVTEPTPQARVEQHDYCYGIIIESGGGAKPGTYTAPWWWNPKMGGTEKFADSPLWYANYGVNDGKQPPIPVVNFGGWTKVGIHQYTSTLYVAGRNRDANYWFLGDEVSQDDFNDLVLACFSGSEDRDANGKTLPKEERLPIALTRMRNRADGGFGSIADRAESAYVIAQQGGAGGGIAPHTHTPGGVQ